MAIKKTGPLQPAGPAGVNYQIYVIEMSRADDRVACYRRLITGIILKSLL